MKINASDPDIETLVGRIKRKELDLRPDFQRGEVWSDAKRQKLIDTILRGWQVPPLHLVSVSQSMVLEVLDGQQRLAAIRDFAADKLKIDGWIKPIAPELQRLDSCVFGSLPPQWQRRFNQYPLRVFIVTDYQPDEPYELFYRLNQPTTLTAAEQRNAFFGAARQQVKDLVQVAQDAGLTRDSIGFSNGRMAYDDVLARACVYSEARTFKTRVTAAALNDKYRSSAPFTTESVDSVRQAIHLFALALATEKLSLQLNKATLLSWLLFSINNEAVAGRGDLLAQFVRFFEDKRFLSRFATKREDLLERGWFQLYEDRASSRVNDTLSIVARDFVLWLFLAASEIKVGSTAKFDYAEQSLDWLRRNAQQNKFLDPEHFVQSLLDSNSWDLTDAGREAR